MIQVSQFKIPEDTEKLNAFLIAKEAELAPDSIKIFIDKIVVLTYKDEQTDAEKAQDIIDKNLDQLKASLITLDFSIRRHRRNAATGDKKAIHKLTDAEGAKASVFEDIKFYEETLAAVKDGSWLDPSTGS